MRESLVLSLYEYVRALGWAPAERKTAETVPDSWIPVVTRAGVLVGPVGNQY